ncbi:RES family NAD+ phosphorylase [Rhodococcus sp. CH91]|uniref:RES family NAD+ phosphorylase n=1 Tax=Rhodococcus sp. CH91 TaxID=2910256 RepID=UPI001F4A8E74|nr:RES family NAD+ phosphorylase [Rhodococcus sp. CH91]
MSRDDLALRAPGTRALIRFPRWRLTRRTSLKRGHRATNGPWWFSSSGDGRFDLRSPRGTCYLAFDDRTAIRETVGESLTSLGVITREFAADRVISTLRVPSSHTLADTCAESAADFGLTRELATMTPYDIPHAWAAALDTDFDGIRYQTRFTTTPNANAAALFGPAGEADWPADPQPEPLTLAASRCGIAVQTLPRAVRIVEPPE